MSDILNNIPKSCDIQIHTLKVRAPYQLSEYQYRSLSKRKKPTCNNMSLRLNELRGCETSSNNIFLRLNELR
jgi:hypothetical protein